MPQTITPQIDRLTHQFDRIDNDRKRLLSGISQYVASRVRAGKPAQLTFICTHNSRRSQMSQIWARAAAVYRGIDPVNVFSGGTEVTAFHANAIRAMANAGFEISGEIADGNPRYRVMGEGWDQSLIVYSKIFDQPPNPTTQYAAIMTCGHADSHCPNILGCDARFSLPYEDPKAFDGTDIQDASYNRRARQIGREMLYLFSQVDTRA